MSMFLGENERGEQTKKTTKLETLVFLKTLNKLQRVDSLL